MARNQHVRGFGKNIQKKVRQTFTNLTPADTGQEMATITGAATITTGGWDVTTAPALTSVSKGMGEPDVYLTSAYTSASTSAGSKDGIAFWGTSASGGTWWAAYPTTTTGTGDNTYNYCNTTVHHYCEGPGTSNSCWAWSGTPADCYSASCSTGHGCTGASCTTANTASCGFAGQNLCVSITPCGSICGNCTSAGPTITAKCCTCPTDNADTCDGTLSTCTYYGCTPSNNGACCNSITYTGGLYTIYYTGVRIDSGAPASMTQQSANATLVSSTGGYPAVGGLTVTTSGNSIAVKLYSDTALSSQQGSTHNYSPASPTKGDYVGVYGSNTGSVTTDTFTAES